MQKIKCLIFLFYQFTSFIKLNALCPNSCNGHGSCDMFNKCTCFPGWQGGSPDCSLSMNLTFF